MPRIHIVIRFAYRASLFDSFLQKKPPDSAEGKPHEGAETLIRTVSGTFVPPSDGTMDQFPNEDRLPLPAILGQLAGLPLA